VATELLPPSAAAIEVARAAHVAATATQILRLIISFSGLLRGVKVAPILRSTQPTRS
jgi:hypothetical protein